MMWASFFRFFNVCLNRNNKAKKGTLVCTPLKSEKPTERGGGEASEVQTNKTKKGNAV